MGRLADSTFRRLSLGALQFSLQPANLRYEPSRVGYKSQTGSVGRGLLGRITSSESLRRGRDGRRARRGADEPRTGVVRDTRTAH